MASSSSSKLAGLKRIIAELRCQPKPAIVEKLSKEGTIESLTGLKEKLYEECQVIPDFPKGEFYTRRKPKNASTNSSLQERLADDICELSNCQDTRVVTAEIRNMFKSAAAVIIEDQGGVMSVDSDSKLGEISCSPAMLNRSTGWTGIRDQVASLQSEYLLFRERLARNFIELEEKVKALDTTVKNQNSEIASLKEENKHLRVLCAHSSSSKGASLLGLDKGTYASCVALSSTNNDDNMQISEGCSDVVRHSRVNESVIVVGDEVIKEATSSGNDEQAAHSEVSRNQQLQHTHSNPDSDDDGEFIGVERSRMKVNRFFLTGIAENVKSDQIYLYLQKRNINPTHLRLFTSRRKGTVSAKINIRPNECENVLEKDFWPKFVICKPWLTKGKLEKLAQDKLSKG